MISDFDLLKLQLSELAEVINKFESESVQLRVVELVLGETGFTDQQKPNAMASKPSRKRKSRTNGTAKQDNPKRNPKRSRANAQGAAATLNELVESGFFSTPRTLNDIVQHCEVSLARRFRPSDFSAKLIRLTRDNTLSRSRNPDSQYEYVKD